MMDQDNKQMAILLEVSMEERKALADENVRRRSKGLPAMNTSEISAFLKAHKEGINDTEYIGGYAYGYALVEKYKDSNKQRICWDQISHIRADNKSDFVFKGVKERYGAGNEEVFKDQIRSAALSKLEQLMGAFFEERRVNISDTQIIAERHWTPGPPVTVSVYNAAIRHNKIDGGFRDEELMGTIGMFSCMFGKKIDLHALKYNISNFYGSSYNTSLLDEVDRIRAVNEKDVLHGLHDLDASFLLAFKNVYFPKLDI